MNEPNTYTYRHIHTNIHAYIKTYTYIQAKHTVKDMELVVVAYSRLLEVKRRHTVGIH